MNLNIIVDFAVQVAAYWLAFRNQFVFFTFSPKSQPETSFTVTYSILTAAFDQWISITSKCFTNEKSSCNKDMEDAEYEKSMNKLYEEAQIS